MESDEEVSFAAMKRVVEDAGMYEHNMSTQEIEETWRIINESKTLATNEEASRLFEDQDMPDISVVTDECFPCNQEPELEAGESVDENDQHIKNLNETLIKDATKVAFGYSDMLDCPKNELTIIDRVPKYKTIFDCLAFINGTEFERNELLHSYHRYLNHIQRDIAKKQSIKAPMPDPIKISISCSSDQSDEFEAETYISRSGRHTKRKNYTYNSEDSQDGTTCKKSKVSEESEWLSKSQAVQPASKPRTFKFKKATASVENDAKNLIEEEAPGSPVISAMHDAPTPKPLTIAAAKKMANEEIIKRSKLFDDSPVRSPRNTSRRCEAMFDKMKEDEKVKQKTEQEMERFEDSLVAASQEVDTEEVKVQEENDLDVIVLNTEPAKRRVIPPIPGRRPPIHSKKSAKPNGASGPPKAQKAVPQPYSKSTDDDDDDVKYMSIRRKRPAHDQSTFDDILVDNPPSTSEKPNLDKINCPICAKAFSKTQIAEHASTCGDEPIITRTSAIFQKITCDICDRAFTLNTDYEVHTRECRRQQEESDRRHRSRKFNI